MSIRKTLICILSFALLYQAYKIVPVILQHYALRLVMRRGD